ncbi:MAG: response regulator transcription factor [Prolixibacteraceae bacterium]|jgi:DNA-binding NarL/FixJ family response regulator|nr:response regulator transcription factor [Prolixibacteraceae bacterium]
MEKTTKIVLVEDQETFAGQVKSFFLDHSEYEFLAHFKSVEEAFQSACTGMANLLLLDIGLPGISGVDAIPEIFTCNPELKIIMLTVFEDDKNLFQALKNGANGYLLKSDCFVHLEQAINQVMNGGMLFSPLMAQKVLKHFRRKIFSKFRLTSQEKKIVLLMKEGLLKKEIADQLQIKYYTVDSHIKNIYKKLQVNSNVQAVIKAGDEGLI